jgi:hypothetical protein
MIAIILASVVLLPSQASPADVPLMQAFGAHSAVFVGDALLGHSVHGRVGVPPGTLWLISRDGTAAFGFDSRWDRYALPSGRYLGRDFVYLHFLKEGPSTRSLTISQHAHLGHPPASEWADRNDYNGALLLDATNAQRLLVARAARLERQDYVIGAVADLADRSTSPNWNFTIRVPGKLSSSYFPGRFDGEAVEIGLRVDSKPQVLRLRRDKTAQWRPGHLSGVAVVATDSHTEVRDGARVVGRRPTPDGTIEQRSIAGERVVWQIYEDKRLPRTGPRTLIVWSPHTREDATLDGYALWGRSNDGNRLLVLRQRDSKLLLLTMKPQRGDN